MPELPEVEVIVRQLIENGHVLENQIVKLTFFRPQRWLDVEMGAVTPRLVGRRFSSVSRRGKYIIFTLDDSQKLVIHLRMTGKLLWLPNFEQVNSHTREIFHFQDGSSLQFNDSRTLGRLYLLEPNQALDALEKLGVEPVSPDFSEKILREQLASCNREMKDFLMDQKKIAGIGNIYASEILFRCSIHPKQRSGSLTGKEIKKLTREIPAILELAIQNKGTTIFDYRTAENKTGEFQNMLKVYGKAGEPCPNCGAEIQRIIQQQRSSFFCPACQKM